MKLYEIVFIQAEERRVIVEARSEAEVRRRFEDGDFQVASLVYKGDPKIELIRPMTPAYKAKS
jgi:hypothetical protein